MKQKYIFYNFFVLLRNKIFFFIKNIFRDNTSEVCLMYGKLKYDLCEKIYMKYSQYIGTYSYIFIFLYEEW